MLKHPQEYLEEMRDLVSKVETLLSASKHSLPAAAENVVVSVTEVAATVSAPAPVPEAAPAAAVAAAPEAVPVPVAAAPELPPLPTPELIGEQLPGGLPIQEE
jgi:hypothetical protein